MTTPGRTRKRQQASLGLERLESRCLMDANSAAFVMKAFQDLLGRAPEPGAANFFIGFLNKGAPSRPEVALTIENSIEYLKGFAAPAYAGFLNRPADPAGEANAVQLLASTGSPN